MRRLTDAIARHGHAVFFDVGGAVGLESLVASGYGAREIHVFEPDRTALVFLRRNLRGIDYRLTTKYVGAEDGAETVTLDAYCRATGAAPTHVKLDIEGHEIEALRGMEEVLGAHRPMRFI